jgi:hypothetical protein
MRPVTWSEGHHLHQKAMKLLYMSYWYEIKKQEDVELSDDKKNIEILFNSDSFGNYYVEVPIEFVLNVIKEHIELQ